MKKKYLIAALIFYVVSAAASYGAMSYFSPDQSGTTPTVPTSGQTEEGETKLATLLDIDPNEPKDQPCPLNGAYYTKTEQEAWQEHRPLFVMIENHQEARPQSGLSDADVVFEAVAEGGVTRFGAMYYCEAQAIDVTLAPVRSARTYFVDYASGFYRPLYVHVGGANVPGPTDALGQLGEYGWEMENDLNQFSIPYPIFVRNANRLEGKTVATEHTMESSTERLWKVGTERGWDNVAPDYVEDPEIAGEAWTDLYQGWTFEQEKPEIGSIEQISYDFWSGYNDFSVSWEYDADKDAFLRSQGGEPHTDHNNGEQIAAANVVLLKTTEKGPINEEKHMIYGTIGTGDVLIFKHGDVVEATWSKPQRTSELKFVDAYGQPIEMARGLTWISVLGLANEVAY